ncbi:preprotein translocase subunit YajC [Haloactinopolyspora sp.]|jgi:preprotein translocase subunit YajC|uniref:preprotein translocase subunit YajC n=1 Tax=Haloactinopolyspora sp. TaxID=1966353 RepID=UPI00261B42C4|nr:preprotein translocase subunit YajC [Haloactinopolyspora sp.]
MDAASLLLPILLIAVFYFLLIRPQQKQRRAMAELQRTVSPGARVMTSAGLLATVVAVEDDEVVLEVAPGVHNRYVRRAIVNVLSPGAQSSDESSGDTGTPEPSASEDRTNGDDAR